MRADEFALAPARDVTYGVRSIRPGPGRLVQQSPLARDRALRVRRARRHHHLPGQLRRAAAASRAAHRAAGDHRQGGRRVGRSTWVGLSTRDFTDVDVDRIDADVRTRLGVVASAPSPSTLVATTSSCPLRPSPTCSSTCTGPAPLVTPPRVAPSSPSRVAAPGSASVSPTPRSPSSATRPTRAWSAHRSWSRTPRSSEASVFDNGLPLQRTAVGRPRAS